MVFEVGSRDLSIERGERMIATDHGITDMTVIAAGNAKAVDMGEIGREAFLDRLDAALEAQAA